MRRNGLLTMIMLLAQACIITWVLISTQQPPPLHVFW